VQVMSTFHAARAVRSASRPRAPAVLADLGSVPPEPMAGLHDERVRASLLDPLNGRRTFLSHRDEELDTLECSEDPQCPPQGTPALHLDHRGYRCPDSQWMHDRSLHTLPCLGRALISRCPEMPRKRFIDDPRAFSRPMRGRCGLGHRASRRSATTHCGGLCRTSCGGIAESVSVPHRSKGGREE
jgi:hypothetical protein